MRTRSRLAVIGSGIVILSTILAEAAAAVSTITPHG